VRRLSRTPSLALKLSCDLQSDTFVLVKLIAFGWNAIRQARIFSSGIAMHR
jgi:hypothetical protein